MVAGHHLLVASLPLVGLCKQDGVKDNAMKNPVACGVEEVYGSVQILVAEVVVSRNLLVLLQPIRIAKNLVEADCVHWRVMLLLLLQLPPRQKDWLARVMGHFDHPLVDNLEWVLSTQDGFP